MRMLQSIFAEQPDSLAHRLVEAGFQQGDEAKIELVGVGVHEPICPGAVNLAFCPLPRVLILPDTYQEGVWVGSSDPSVEPAVWFDRPSCELIKGMRGHHGFVRLQAELQWTKHWIHLNKLRFLKFASYDGPVNRPGSFEDSGLTLVT